MKKKLGELLSHYLPIVFAFLPALFFTRLTEYISLQYFHAVPSNTWKMLVWGYLLDNVVFFSFALFVLLVFLLLGWWKRRLAQVVAFILFFLFTLVNLLLVKYFTTTLVPLDQVIFHYTPNEILFIVRSSSRLAKGELLSILLLLLTPFLTYWLVAKVKFPFVALATLLGILVSSPVVFIMVNPNQNNYLSDFEYYVRSSKVYYLASRINSFQLEYSPTESSNPSISAAIKRYHQSNPQFTYLSPQYPLLRVDATPDVLGNYFAFGSEKPNLVFIIVESLSTSFMGDKAYYGSFMPFLDSLANQGLYWNNFLSSAERTFNVLPAVFGSLPYCNSTFNVSFSPPYHFSMIRYLKENGYSTHFFYGGDPHFGGYDFFLHRQDIDYILTHFGKQYRQDIIQEKKFEWGYPDGDLFRRSMEVVDSLKVSPRLDIYLTLSTHAPFTPPNEEYFRQRFNQRLSQLNLSPEKKKMVEVQKNIFTSIMYTDQALREFFAEYQKRDDYKNTLFFITGDHAMPELNYTYLNILERYHVPFIIYSPMLKKAERFESVSSHFDITPTVLAMMRNAGFLLTRDQCHWLGEGIDVSTKFRNTHKMPFIYNNGVQAEFLDGNKYLSVNRLFELLPNLNLKFIKDSAVATKLKGQLADYLVISQDILNKNELIPTDLYLAGSFREMVYQGAVPVQFTKLTTRNIYLELTPYRKILADFQFMDIDMSIIMNNKSGDTTRPVRLIFQVVDDKMQNHAWFQYDLLPYPSDDSVKRVGVKQYINLSGVKSLENKTLKLYLYNPAGSELYLDDLRLEMNGYKKNKQFIKR